jgi:hypothetical protein
VDGGLGALSPGRALQRRDAPVLDVVHEHVEGRLVELDDVDAERLELARLLVEDPRRSHRHVGAPP